MPKRRSQVKYACFLPLVGLSILCIVVILGAVISVPARVEQIYGPPASNLSTINRLRYSLTLYLRSGDLTKPVDRNGTSRSFSIEQGESTSSVIERLRAEGLISNSTAFSTYLLYAGLDTSIQAGDYLFSPAMTPLEIAKELQDATPYQVKFGVLPGWRIEEIAASLPSSGLPITPDEFLAAAATRPPGYSFTTDLPEPPSLEGFLFPDSYLIPRLVTASELIRVLLDNFEKRVTPEIRQGFTRQGLSLYQAVSLASLVQREAIVEDEMPVIASVFLNRLAAGMTLDSDPTVQFALGYNTNQHTWWTNPLSLDDLQIESPYNTYYHQGLPPGPIANPGMTALSAVASPTQTPYYYFRAACDGTGRHSFSKDFEEHLGKSCP